MPLIVPIKKLPKEKNSEMTDWGINVPNKSYVYNPLQLWLLHKKTVAKSICGPASPSCSVRVKKGSTAGVKYISIPTISILSVGFNFPPIICLVLKNNVQNGRKK